MDLDLFPYKNILVTGGCGFIGSNFINYMVKKYPMTNFYNVDCLTYCANVTNIEEPVRNASNYKFYNTKLQNTTVILDILRQYSVDCVVHFAAQSHVDISFVDALLFTEDNIVATHMLLESCKYAQEHKWIDLKRFIHISTDEVYGDSSLNIPECKIETSILNPTNPYAASKAAAEMICKSYYYSYNLPLIITRSNNVYGKNQYHDKLVPKFITLLLNNEKCTIHGHGNYLRSFVHVYDKVSAIELLLLNGVVGETYNIASDDEYTVNQIAEILIRLIKGEHALVDYWKVNIGDRVFNDTRYHISCDKLKALGWTPKVNFLEGLLDTINFYTR